MDWFVNFSFIMELQMCVYWKTTFSLEPDFFLLSYLAGKIWHLVFWESNKKERSGEWTAAGCLQSLFSSHKRTCSVCFWYDSLSVTCLPLKHSALYSPEKKNQTSATIEEGSCPVVIGNRTLTLTLFKKPSAFLTLTFSFKWLPILPVPEACRHSVLQKKLSLSFFPLVDKIWLP